MYQILHYINIQQFFTKSLNKNLLNLLKISLILKIAVLFDFVMFC